MACRDRHRRISEECEQKGDPWSNGTQRGGEEVHSLKEERRTRKVSTINVKGTRQDEDREATVTWKEKTPCS